MFVHDFVYADAPTEAICARILENRGAWLGSLAGDAAGEGGKLRVRLGPAGPIPGLSAAVVVELGPSRRRADNAMVVPLTWRASGAAAAFQVLSADLEIASLGETRTQLSLMGRYDPPLGALGWPLDQPLLHRIAEATVRSFLRRLAAALEEGRSGDRATP